jgi:hypothetical protein
VLNFEFVCKQPYSIFSPQSRRATPTPEGAKYKQRHYG